MSRISIAAAAAALGAAALALAAACGSDNNSSTPDAGTPDAGTGTSTAALCTAYCAEMVATCTGSDTQFDGANDAASCQTACTAQYKWVQTDDNKSPGSSGDDLTCRKQHADLAAAAKAANDAAGVTLHCGHAGPTGNKLCGTVCDVYCDLQMANCSSANPNLPSTQPANFASRDACETACQAVNGGAGFTFDQTKPRAILSPDPTLSTNSGNTFQCRVWHVGEAAANPNPHCFHSRIISVLPNGTSAGPCS